MTGHVLVFGSPRNRIRHGKTVEARLAWRLAIAAAVWGTIGAVVCVRWWLEWRVTVPVQAQDIVPA